LSRKNKIHWQLVSIRGGIKSKMREEGESLVNGELAHLGGGGKGKREVVWAVGGAKSGALSEGWVQPGRGKYKWRTQRALVSLEKQTKKTEEGKKKRERY